MPSVSFSFSSNYLPFSTFAFILSLVASKIKSQTQRIKKSYSRGNFQLETVETEKSENFKFGAVTDMFASWEWCSAWFILISQYIIKVGWDSASTLKTIAISWGSSVVRTSENVSSWMNMDTGYHNDVMPGVILALMLVSLALSTYRRILRLLNIGDWRFGK